LSPDEILPSGDPDVSAFVVVMAIGFLIGTAGHVYKSKTAVATGIAMIFLATVGLPLILYFGGE
jgi:hypothetical protein